VEVSVYSDFSDRVTGVFDLSKTGERVQAERYDEPGKENFALKDEYDVPDLMASLMGDWSWKPYRYKQDPGHIFTSDEIERLYPGRVYIPNARMPA
jgi:hypothetical protein